MKAQNNFSVFRGEVLRSVRRQNEYFKFKKNGFKRAINFKLLRKENEIHLRSAMFLKFTIYFTGGQCDC